MDWDGKIYFNSVINVVRLAISVVSDETQIHLHVAGGDASICLSQLAAIDADVLYIEGFRYEENLLKALSTYNYPGYLGLGCYEIHDSQIPSMDAIIQKIRRITMVVPMEKLWICPDCGFRNKKWKDIVGVLRSMIDATESLRDKYHAAAR